MLYIYGFGGFAREVEAFLKSNLKDTVQFVVDDKYHEEDDYQTVIPYSEFVNMFDRDEDRIVVAVGDPSDRKNIVSKIDSIENFTNYRSFLNLILKKSVIGGCITTKIGSGNIFCPGSILTANIWIGDHNHFNLNTTIGHDCKIGDFNTFSPGVNISGNVIIGNGCYFGTNSSVRQCVTICDNVTIGMGAVVLNNIVEPGTYVGVPCKKLSK